VTWLAQLVAAPLLTLTGAGVQATQPAVVQHHAPPTTLAPDWAQCPQWWQLALDVGWPPDQLPTLDHVMWRESRCTEDATHRNANGSVDRGLLQVNSVHLPWLAAYGLTAADLVTAGGCLHAALLLWEQQGWAPWRT